MKIKKFWVLFFLFGVSGFLVINSYLKYLESRIVPFESRLNLSQEGFKETFDINSFHTARYTMIIAFQNPEFSDVPWSEKQKRVKEILDFEVDIKFKENDKILIHHTGHLKDWNITNSSFGLQKDCGLYKHNFDANFLAKYTFEISILKGNEIAETFNPSILFHGIDDGYFWLTWQVFNIFWVVFLVLLSVVIAIAKFRT